MVKFVADSSCDVYEIEGVEFVSVPLTIYTEEWQFSDNGKIDIDDMLGKLENHNGRSYTSCPSSDAWLKAFEGGDEIYVVTITSGLSGTYNSAMVARDMYLEEHPEAKVRVFDSLSTGPEMRMAIEKLIEFKKQGLEFDEICDRTQKYLDDVHLFFVLGSVHNLAQNGRINKLVASAVGMLGIRIIGMADELGTIKPIGKARGDQKIIKHIVDALKEHKFNHGKVRICNVANESLASALSNAIRKAFAGAQVLIYPAGGLCSYYAERNGLIIGFES